MNLYPPNPVLISESVLKQLDASPPGQFYAQKKLDGRRRIVTRNADGSYAWHAKDRYETLPVPDALRTTFESMEWPPGITLDVEYTGLRHKNGTPELYVFDLLALHGEWLTMPFEMRYRILGEFGILNDTPHVYRVDVMANPQMAAMYKACQSDPLCEGVVIRAADQINVGTRDRCKDGAGIFKVKFR
jgi:hypothetical protein